MITLDLVEFIEKEQKKDVSNDVIKSRLLEAGWNSEDIEEGFAKVTPAYTMPTATPTAIKIQEVKQPQEKIITPSQDNSAFSNLNRAVPFIATSTPKDIPVSAPVVAKPTIDPYREAPVDKPIIKDNFSTPNPNQNLPKVWAPANTPIAVEEKHEPLPTLMPKISAPESSPIQNKTLPPLFSPERKMELAKVHASPELTANAIPSMTKAPLSTPPGNSFSNKAMISSYPKDVKNNFVFEGEKKHGVPKFLIWVFVIVVLLCLAAGASFAYTNGLIDIPFLPKVNPNVVTVDLSKNLTNTNQNPVVQANTTPSIDQNASVSVDQNSSTAPDVKIDTNSPTASSDKVTVVEIKTNDELKGKDSMIENYVSSIELQIYKKYAMNKNKYGSVSNLKGDCVAPVKDSLFYTDPADTSDKTIAHFLNPLLELEGNKGYCFSNTKSWAMSFPLATDENSYVCLDNNSSKIYTKNILTGTVCK